MIVVLLLDRTSCAEPRTAVRAAPTATVASTLHPHAGHSATPSSTSLLQSGQVCIEAGSLYLAACSRARCGRVGRDALGYHGRLMTACLLAIDVGNTNTVLGI